MAVIAICPQTNATPLRIAPLYRAIATPRPCSLPAVTCPTPTPPANHESSLQVQEVLRRGAEGAGGGEAHQLEDVATPLSAAD